MRSDAAVIAEELMFMARPAARPAFVAIDTSNLTERQVALMQVALAPLPADLVIPRAFAYQRVQPGDPERARATWLRAVHVFLNARQLPRTEILLRTREEYAEERSQATVSQCYFRADGRTWAAGAAKEGL